MKGLYKRVEDPQNWMEGHFNITVRKKQSEHTQTYIWCSLIYIDSSFIEVLNLAVAGLTSYQVKQHNPSDIMTDEYKLNLKTNFIILLTFY